MGHGFFPCCGFDSLWSLGVLYGVSLWFSTGYGLFSYPLSLPLSFLDNGRKYKAVIYKDGVGADWKLKPEAYAIETMTVDSKTVLKVWLAPGGGAAVSIVAL